MTKQDQRQKTHIFPAYQFHFVITMEIAILPWSRYKA